jgi:hypothetical protein
MKEAPSLVVHDRCDVDGFALSSATLEARVGQETPKPFRLSPALRCLRRTG